MPRLPAVSGRQLVELLPVFMFEEEGAAVADEWRWVVTFRRPGREAKVVYVSQKMAWSKDEAISIARRKAPPESGWQLEKAIRGRG